jgi:arsenate reductase
VVNSVERLPLLPAAPTERWPMTKVFNVLFLCTGNSARSILAEAIINRDGGPHFRGYSAGSQPKGVVHPLALRVLKNFGYPTDGLTSKSWHVYAGPDSPRMDFVFTVCDNAAGETCPLWPGQPMTAHWGIKDPAAVEGSDIHDEAAFVTAFNQLKRRISVFTSLPLAHLDDISLQAKLRDIGQMEGATNPQPEVA